MWSPVALVLFIGVVIVQSEFLYKKFCDDGGDNVFRSHMAHYKPKKVHVGDIHLLANSHSRLERYPREETGKIIFLQAIYQTVIIISLAKIFLVAGLEKDDSLVSPHLCEIYNVILEPCVDGRSFCTIKRIKRYTLSIDFMPKFNAKKLNMSMAADDASTGTYDKVIKSPNDACNYLTCPVEAQIRRIFDVDFSLGKTFAVGKFPIKVKLFDQENERQSCCFTFNVKTIK